MQCKDISTADILSFLAGAPAASWGGLYPATLSDGWPNSIGKAVPFSVPDKLFLSKMSNLIKRGLVDACACGCSGDFKITDLGQHELQRLRPDIEVPASGSSWTTEQIDGAIRKAERESRRITNLLPIGGSAVRVLTAATVGRQGTEFSDEMLQLWRDFQLNGYVDVSLKRS